MSAYDIECLLPVQGGKDRQELESIASSTLQDCWKASDRRPLLVHLIKVSWAILLEKYTGKQTSVFGSIEESRGVPTRLVSQVEQWSVLPDNDELLIKQAQQLSVHPWCKSSDTEFLFNTCLWVRTHDGLSGNEIAARGSKERPSSDCALSIMCEHNTSTNSLTCSMLHLSTPFSVAVLDSFMEIFMAVIADQGTRYRQMSLLGPQSIDMIRKWNAPGLQTKGAFCIHTLVLEQCLRQPLAPAVCAWDGSITYCDLERLSETVAQKLVALHIGPGSVVPICFEKSLWAAVAILAVLRAGAAFTLLDPSYPLARLQLICEEVKPQIILTSCEKLPLSQQLHKTVMILPNSAERSLTPGDIGLLAIPENAAYVAFTSGSTGKPKGVVIEHRSFCASARANSIIQNLQATSRVLQFASYGFDISIQEILSTLIAGGCVCIPSEEQRLQSLPAAIRELQVNWMELTPTVARMLHPDELPLVQTVVLGGEPMQPSDMATWCHGKQLMNAYGPTECSIVATVQPNPDVEDPLDIGRSYCGTCWVVNPDDHHQLLPLGAIGELVIGGPIVGRGYINRPADESFITSPQWASQFQITSKESFYKTGDLVRYNVNNGTLRYCGRKDTQVKIHGQRVELHEIEHCAEAYSRGMVVVAEILKPDQGPTFLALFIVGNGEGGPVPPVSPGDGVASTIDTGRRASFALLHQWLTDKLPRFMVPSLYIPLTHVPILPTGKVNRRALRNITTEIAIQDLRSYVPTVSGDWNEMTGMERVLHRLMADQLGVPPDRVGRSDNFFKLGGNSIMAIDLVNKLREHGWDLTVADFFTQQTITGLARVALRVKPILSIPAFSLVENGHVYLRMAAEQCRVCQERIQDMYPCTPLQEGLMLLSSELGYHFAGTFAFQLPSYVNLDLFQKNWEQIVSTRPILRTRIVRIGDNETYQVVIRDRPHWNVGTSLNDVSNRVNNYTLCFGEPLIRYGLVNQGPGGRGPLFVIRMHHAVFDGWSYRSLLDDIERLYDGQPLTQRESMNRLLHHTRRLDLKAASAFWRTAFNGLQGPIFPAPPPGWVRPILPAVKRHQVSLATTSRGEYTMASVVQLAWAIVVSSRTGSDDVVFGTTVSGRNAPVPGIDHLMGPAIATFPIRIALDMDSSIDNMLKKTQSWVTSTIPFEQTGLIRIGRTSSTATLACQFQTLLVIQPRPLRRQSKLLIDLPQNHDQQREFQAHILTIVVELQEEGMHIEVIFDESVLHTEEVDHMLEQLEDVIRQILDRPSASLRTVRYYTQSDREQIREWNKEKIFKPSVVHEVIEKWLVSQPNALAISAWDGSFTYHQLFEHARIWAGYLQAHGALQGTVVAICMERSKLQIVAMIGVLLAGSAFMMLEPEFPCERLREMCHTANTTMIISSPAKSGQTKMLGVDSVITLTEDLLLTCRKQYSWVPPRSNLHTPMYVAFTSGSTGSPKGITIEHAMCHVSAQAYQNTLGLGNKSRVLYNTSVAFDLLIIETMWTLLAGGCICIPSETVRLCDLLGAMKDLQPNCVFLTPPVARMLSPADMPSLDTMVLVGEAVSTSDIDKWAHEVPLKVGYGPAECSVLSSARELLPSNRDEPSNIGRCLNGRSWIVDPNNYHRLLPIGAVGELLLSGLMVARGYINNSRLSQTSFVRRPTWASEFDIPMEERFYKTGDLVRYTSDGTMQYLGCRDTQVKLHGQRIELEEIEQRAELFCTNMATVASLVEFQATSRSKLVLFLAPKTVGKKQSGLFGVMSNEIQLLAKDLKAHLRTVLAPYMVPSLVIPLTWLPLTTSGKTDRKLLQQKASKLSAELLASYSNTSSTKREPYTEIQLTLRQIFADALAIQVDVIGIDQSFFDTGGDSLSAMRVLALSRKHGLAITMADLLERKSISLLSERLESVRPMQDSLISQGTKLSSENRCDTRHCVLGKMKDVQSQLWCLPSQSIQDAFECPAQHLGIIADQPLTACTHKQRSIWEIRSPSALKSADVAYALKQVISRHSMLRSILLPSTDDPTRVIQVVLKEAHRAVQIVKAPGIKTAAQVREFRPVQCRDGSMPHHSTLVEGPDRQVWWLFEFDKAFVDAASMTILLEELAALCGNRHCQLEPAPCYSQYASFVHSLRQEESILFWEQTLRGIAPCLIPKSENITLRSTPTAPRVHTVIKQINGPGMLQALSNSLGLTATNIFQTIWGLVLARSTGSTDVCFGALKSCRDASVPGILQMVGPLFNILPCRLQFKSVRPTTYELLDTLQSNQFAMAERSRHQHTSLQSIVQATRVVNDRLFNTCLTVQPAMVTPAERQNVHFELLESHDPTEYNIVAAVIIFPSHYELHIRFWDDFYSENEALCLLDQFCDTTTEISAVVGSMNG
ncbi:hypothetical protein ETB97_006247 [Aspergillus alliaceus]|uniref:Carrier domain-containing protein n=1 Tax=Petromyces alliaceus TaxID=209559 RepID=A0A8H6E3G7_PETAA|nr:hypothetical protein ETB97_006247 [Aspergillus burnettii]